MNANQPNIKPLEPVSFDDLEPEVLEVPAELPTPEGGSLKDRIMAQAKKEEAEVAAVEAAKEQVRVDKPVVAPVQPVAPVELPAPEPPAAPEPPVAPVPEAPAPVPELPPVPEITAETAPTETEQPKSSTPQAQDQPATPPPAAAPVQVNAEKTETRKQIESILQEGLAPMFLQMNTQERLAFTQAANETASKLELLVTQFKATAKEVLRLIRAWLTKIPKVNKYFLEQASKIKTDEILLIQTQKKKESRLLH